MGQNGRASKAQRDQFRSQLLAQGYGHEQIAAEMARRFRCRPRTAWRYAYDWTQKEIADRFNRITGDPNAPMTEKRISDYEAWPLGGSKPTIIALFNLARVFSTQLQSLVDFDDLQHMTDSERSALKQSASGAGPILDNDRNPSQESKEHRSPAHSVLQNNVYVPSGCPQQIPPNATILVNRHAEVRQLDALARDENRINASTTSKIMVISGPPGVGKSALLIHWALRAKKHFPDGQLYVDLRGYSLSKPMLPEHALDEFLRSLGVPDKDIPGSLVGQSSLFRSLTAGQRILVLIDNVDASDRVRPLLTGPGPACVVLTSRNRLSGLAIREGAHPMTLTMLTPDDAENLLRSALGDQRIGEEASAVSEICRLCGYLPLALRIVAERAASRPQLPLQELAEELSEESERLDILTTTDDETAAIRHVFSWSYRSLTVDAAMLFRLIGLHAGPDISQGALTALTGMPPRSFRHAVDSLIEAHLLQEFTPHRFTIHDLLHSYAREMVETEESESSRNAAVQRLGTWYLSAAIAADRYLTPGFETPLPTNRPVVQVPKFDNFDQALQWFEEERSNLLAYVQNSQRTEDFEAAVIITRTSWGFFNMRKYWSDWIECDKAGLAASRSIGDIVNEAWILTSLGVAYRNLRRTEEAIECHQKAADLFQTRGELSGMAFAQQNLANVQTDSGDYEAALSNYQAALDAFQELPDGMRGRSIVLLSLGTTHGKIGRFAEAIDYATQGAALCEELRDQQGTAIALHIQGTANLKLGNINTAIEKLQESINIGIAIKDGYGQARSLDSLGNALNSVGRSAEAVEAWSKALTIYREIEAPEAVDVELKLPS